MRRIFKQFRGSVMWAAKELSVSHVTISRYLSGYVLSAKMDAKMPQLAKRLKETNGACIADVNGKSVRSQVKKIRRGKR